MAAAYPYQNTFLNVAQPYPQWWTGTLSVPDAMSPTTFLLPRGSTESRTELQPSVFKEPPRLLRCPFCKSRELPVQAQTATSLRADCQSCDRKCGFKNLESILGAARDIPARRTGESPNRTGIQQPVPFLTSTDRSSPTSDHIDIDVGVLRMESDIEELKTSLPSRITS